MAKMIPTTIDPEVKSNAERKVFKLLNGLDYENAHVLHSLGLAYHRDKLFGEIDFVLITESGIMCIEVKGGLIKRTNGKWQFINRYGKISEKTEGPFAQAQGNMNSLRDYLKKRLGKNHKLVKCQYSCCVIMPDCNFESEGVDVIKEILFNQKSSFENFQGFIKNCYLYWSDLCFDKHNFRGGLLRKNDITNSVSYLRGNLAFIPKISTELKRVDDELIQLTSEQHETLAAFSENDRMIISGVAGTGKTLLAIEKCRREVYEGKKVLFLCYNNVLAGFIREKFPELKQQVDIKTFHSKLEESVCIDSMIVKDNAYYDEYLPNEFYSNYSETIEKYDVVIIDEGQDLLNITYLMCIEKFLKGGYKDGRWSIFLDENQNIFNGNSDCEESLNYLLKEIADNNYHYTHIVQAKTKSVSGHDVEHKSYKTLYDGQKELKMILRNLQGKGVNLSSVVILSKYATTNPKSILFNFAFDNSSINVLENPDAHCFCKRDKNQLSIFTVQKFKGLDSRIVIYVDLDSITDIKSRNINYVGISRARTKLFVLYNDIVKEDKTKYLKEALILMS